MNYHPGAKWAEFPSQVILDEVASLDGICELANLSSQIWRKTWLDSISQSQFPFVVCAFFKFDYKSVIDETGVKFSGVSESNDATISAPKFSQQQLCSLRLENNFLQ